MPGKTLQMLPLHHCNSLPRRSAYGETPTHRFDTSHGFRASTPKGVSRLSKAAELKGVAEDMFKRHYRHPIRKIGSRRVAVVLGAAIDYAPPQTEVLNPESSAVRAGLRSMCNRKEVP